MIKVFMFLYYIVYYSNCSIKLDFSCSKQKIDLTESNFLEITVNNDILAYLYMGVKNQKINVKIDTFGPGLYIYNNSDYEPYSSVLFKNVENSELCRFQDEKFCEENFNLKCSRSKDLVSMGEGEVKSIEMEFFLVDKNSSRKYESYSGILGVDFNCRYFKEWKYKGFMSQLEDYKLIGDSNFKITFTNDDKGSIIFGLNEKELASFANAKNYLHKYIIKYEWKIQIEEVRYSSKLLEMNAENHCLLRFNFGIEGLVAPLTYITAINKNFFNKYDLFSRHICFIKKEGPNYEYRVCKDDLERYINSFPVLTFDFGKNKTISFNPDELFRKVKLKNKTKLYVFLIANDIKRPEEFVWIGGKIALKKLDLIFDINKNSIGMYFKELSKSSVSVRVIKLILTVILFITIFLIGIRLVILRKKNKAVMRRKTSKDLNLL